MNETLEPFKNWLVARDRSPRTVQAYTADLVHFARWFIQTNGQSLTPDALTPTDVREYRQWMITTQSLAPSTINRHIAALRAYTTWARSAGLIAGTPTNGIKFVAEQRSPPRWLDRQQQAALSRALERMIEHAELKARLTELEDRPAPPELIWARRDVTLVQLMLHTGLRVEEVMTLNVDHIKLRERSGNATVMGKGNKQRTVPLNSEARAAISAWMQVRLETDVEALFVNRQGKRLGKRAIQRVVSRIGKVAEVKGVTSHVLRHSFAKNLVNAGVGLEKVADLMGHSRLDTTRIYTRPGRQDLEQAVEAVVVR